MKVFAVCVLILAVLGPCHADTITDNLAAMITQNSVLPLGAGVALEFAQNLLIAQANSTYAASEPDSLTLSYASLLRAISLEVFPGGPSECDTLANCPLPFLQSTVAIDDRVSVQIFVNGVLYQNGDVINFGSVPVVTPEPRTIALLLLGLALCLLWKVRQQQS